MRIAKGETCATLAVDSPSTMQNELYHKLDKSSFTQREVKFLSHKIADKKLMMKNSKVKVIIKWEPPTKVLELRSFLRLVNYYCLLDQGILGQGGTLDRSTQEELNMALVRRVPTCIRKLEEDYLRGTGPHSSRPHKAIRSPNKCFRLRHWWSPHPKRPSYSFREFEAQQLEMPLHHAKEANDCMRHKWKNLSESEATWERKEDLWQFAEHM